MSNLLITARCNRKCSFCFARRRISAMLKDSHSGSSSMSMDEIRKVMDFQAQSGEHEFRLLGGEPTLHPQFIAIVKEALQRKFHVHVFTNGMMAAATADFLATHSADQVSVLCNVSPQAKDSERLIRMRDYALERLGPRASLGITLTSPEFEYRFIIDAVKRWNLRKGLRIGVAQPIVGKENDFLKPEDYRQAGAAIVAMTRACIKEDILIGFDCGMTLCMFSEEELGVLMTSTEKFTSLCGPIIDIGPDLSVWHCFPLSEVINTRLDRFANRRDLVRYYQKRMRPYRQIGCRPECLRCAYKRRNQCTGGCMAHAINALNRLPPRYAEPTDESAPLRPIERCATLPVFTDQTGKDTRHGMGPGQ